MFTIDQSILNVFYSKNIKTEEGKNQKTKSFELTWNA